MHRYGFQGQEQDDEIKGEGNSLTAEYWQYDTRLGRRWNIDPVIKEHESPYACFANNPIWFMDPNGADSTKVGDNWMWKIEKGDDYGTISNRTGVSIENLRKWNIQNQLDLTSGTLLSISDIRVHIVYKTLTPNIYNLTVSALETNPLWGVLTWSGVPEQYAENRSLACPRGSCLKGSGLSCDEFPYASTTQGGILSMTDCVPSRENSIQGGQLSQLYRKMNKGENFVVIPYDGGPERVPVYVPVTVVSPEQKPILKPIYQPLNAPDQRPNERWRYVGDVPTHNYCPDYHSIFRWTGITALGVMTVYSIASSMAVFAL